MATFLVLCWLLGIAVADQRTMRIPNAAVLPGLVAAGASAISAPQVGLAALAAALPYLLVHIPGWCGGGDVKFAAVCGALAARWDLALAVVTLAAVVSALILLVHRARPVLPHGPVLAGVTVALTVGG